MHCSRRQEQTAFDIKVSTWSTILKKKTIEHKQMNCFNWIMLTNERQTTCFIIQLFNRLSCESLIHLQRGKKISLGIYKYPGTMGRTLLLSTICMWLILLASNDPHKKFSFSQCSRTPISWFHPYGE